jgi:hypothetical protein
MGVVFTNNAETTLAAAITSTSATSISVTSSSTFPAIQAGEHFYATLDDGTNNEIVKVTGVSGTTWTVVRASDSTTARTFANGITVQLRATAALLTDIQENIAAKSANQTVYNATTASSATDYDIGIDPGLESNAMVFLNGVMQHHDTFSFSGSTLTFDTAPSNGLALEVIVDNLINLQSSNLTVDTFTAADVGGNPQVDFVLSDAPAGETNLIVFVDGVFQANDTYTISSTTLSMTDGVTADMVVTVYVMNPVNIGAPSDNTVTSSKLSGNITMPADLTVTGDVAFDSPTFVVDNANSRVGLGTATPSVPVDIVGEVKISSHLNMPDNAIAKFGTGSDLQIYHDGTDTWIDESGAGSLKIRGNYLQLLSPQDELFFQGQANGSSYIYHNGLEKLATTSTGIDVTGTATMDGLTVDGTSDLNGNVTIGTSITTLLSGNDIDFQRAGDSYLSQTGGGSLFIRTNDGTSNKVRLNVSPIGDISFYEDTGTTAKLFWDASAESLAIGHTNPSSTYGLDVAGAIRSTGNAPSYTLRENDASNQTWLMASYGGTFAVRDTTVSGTAYPFQIEAATPTNTLFLDSSGNVGIGETSPDTSLHIKKNQSGANSSIKLENSAGANNSSFSIDWQLASSGTSAQIKADRTNSPAAGDTDLIFSTSTNGVSVVEAMRIDSSGSVGIGTGTNTPKGVLDVQGGVYSNLTLSSAHGYSQNRNWDFISNSFGSGSWGGLSLRQSTGTGGTPSVSRFGIDINGKVGIGTTSPSAKLHIYDGANATEATAQLKIEGTGYVGHHWLNGTAYYIGQNSNGRHLRMYSGSNEGVGVYLTNGGNSWSSYSDERLKENIQDIGSVTEKIKDIRCVTYNRKDVDDENKHETIGFIAQDFIGKFDQVLDESKVLDSDEETRYSIRYTETIPILMKAIQEQQTQIETLKQEIREIREGG